MVGMDKMLFKMVGFTALSSVAASGIQYAGENLTFYPMCSSAIYGPVSESHLDANGLHTYLPASYQQTVPLLIIDCIMYDCTSSGRRSLIHATPPSNTPRSYPDPTMPGTDPCDMTTMVSTSVANGKAAGAFLPWVRNCLMKTYTTEPLVKFVTQGFFAIVIFQQQYPVWANGVAATFFTPFKFDWDKVNAIPTLPFFWMDAPFSINARMLTDSPTIELTVTGDWYRDNNKGDSVKFRNCMGAHILFLILGLPMGAYILFKGRSPLYWLIVIIDALYSPIQNMIAVNEGIQWGNAQHAGSNVFTGNFYNNDFYNFPLTGASNIGLTTIWLRLLIPCLTKVKPLIYNWASFFVTLVYFGVHLFLVLMYPLQPQLNIYAKYTADNKDVLVQQAIDFGYGACLFQFVCICLAFAGGVYKILYAVKITKGENKTILTVAKGLLGVTIFLIPFLALQLRCWEKDGSTAGFYFKAFWYLNVFFGLSALTRLAYLCYIIKTSSTGGTSSSSSSSSSPA